MAAGADSDQDEEVEEFFGNETHTGTGNEGPDFTRAATLGMNGPNPQAALKKKESFLLLLVKF